MFFFFRKLLSFDRCERYWSRCLHAYVSEETGKLENETGHPTNPHSLSYMPSVELPVLTLKRAVMPVRDLGR